MGRDVLVRVRFDQMQHEILEIVVMNLGQAFARFCLHFNADELPVFASYSPTST